MKPIYQISLLIAALFLATNSNAQDNKKTEKKKLHIVLVTNENGKETRIDTTFSDEVALNAYMKDHDHDESNSPEPPMPPNAKVPPAPPSPPSGPHHGKNEVYTYRYNYNDDDGDNNEMIISFDKKEFNDMVDQLKSTISELEKDKNISQKSMQKELQELKKALNKITEETKVINKKVTKTIIKDSEKE